MTFLDIDHHGSCFGKCFKANLSQTLLSMQRKFLPLIYARLTSYRYGHETTTFATTY